ncbi:MAG: hypothetical protein Q8O67_00830 [Deltaproteobacteria bacterium]|nr:hypothetical protein [Deltaproteobacteria bacterium]
MQNTALKACAAAVVLLLSSSAFALPFTDECNEGACRCGLALMNASAGEPVDWPSQGMGTTPTRMFSNGGSQNIPTMCEAAKYLVDGEPAWFTEYFALQEAAGAPGLLHTEIMAPHYGPMIAGSVLAVRAQADRLGDVELEAAAARWLRAVWGLLALTAKDGGFASSSQVNKTDITATEASPANMGGAFVATAGMRAPKGGGGGPSSPWHALFSLAIAHPDREFGARLTDTPAYYGPVYASVVAAGYTVPANGRLDLLSMVPPARAFGLTEEQRAVLLAFTRSRGTDLALLDDVTGLVGSFQSSCLMTWRRTTEGTVSWFGTSELEQRFCNRNKGPHAAVSVVDATNHVTYLHPTALNAPAEGGVVFRQGEEICARLDEGITRCIAMPGGALLYEVSFTPDRGLVLVAGGLPPADEDDPIDAPDVDDDDGREDPPIDAPPVITDPPDAPPVDDDNGRPIGDGDDDGRSTGECCAAAPAPLALGLLVLLRRRRLRSSGL